MVAGDGCGRQQVLGAPAQWRGKPANHPESSFVVILLLVRSAHIVQQRGYPQDDALLCRRTWRVADGVQPVIKLKRQLGNVAGMFEVGIEQRSPELQPKQRGSF